MKIFTNAFLVFLLIFSLSCKQQQEKDPGFDFSGMEQFFIIASILEEDREPSAEEWDRLFETPGYNVLTEGEFTRDFFVERFKIVLMPSKTHELEQALKKEQDQPFHIQHVHHYAQARDNKEELKEYMNDLKANAAEILENSVKKAKRYLPPIEEQGYIPVSFLIFANDARGYTPVVIDMLFAIELGDLLHVLIGHELHHYYRNKILVYDRDVVEDEDEDLIWVFDQIHCEGIADQIDKRKLISSEDGPLHFFAGQWEAMVQNAPEYINEMDKLLCKIADSPGRRAEISSQLRTKLPMSGHPVGFYMTNVVIEKLGKEDLVEKAGNPFAFFRLYNNAAGIDSMHPYFSEKAMNVIEELENKYVKAD